ncbi:MAG: HAD-IC family P-type ATPase [archaeon]
MDEHRVKLGELIFRLKTRENGLRTEQAKTRQKEHGLNIVEHARKSHPMIRYLKQFTNLFAVLLSIGAVLSFAAEYLSPGEGNLQIGIALVMVVFLNATFTFYQEYKADKIMETFLNMMPDKARVLRDGNEIDILAKYLVPGDVILLEEGDKIPADARLLDMHQLKVDHSTLTGESEPQLRSLNATHEDIMESRNMVFSGTTVLSGNGKALVYATGMGTQLGKIANLTGRTEERETTIHKELSHFVKIITVIALILGVSFFAIGLFLERGVWQNMVYMIGIIVANVPEGLLPTVTLCLSIASQKMARKNALVKSLESVETLGSTTVICTDKTGTITQNRMSVSRIFVNQRSIKAGKEIRVPEELTNLLVLCNNSKATERGYHGDPMEIALLEFSEKFASPEEIRNSNPRIAEEPFDSNTKRMITVNAGAKKTTAYLKGAPEVVIAKCNRILINNRVTKLTAEHRAQIQGQVETISSLGERILALAYRQAKGRRVREGEFIFLGLISLIDPPRPEVPDAVRKCKEAGIKVIMITGDYSLTALSIARQVGISKNPRVVTGAQLDGMSEGELKKALSEEVLFARTSPFQKLRIVKTLQSMGHIVAATGDGVNDAPAIKNADIGIAMGIIGTDVAKEASDMILMDDNFATIVAAVEEGRTIFDNIKKFISYILTSNVPEILPFLAFVLLGIPLPLTVALILAIDLGTDLIPALGLGSEGHEPEIMHRKPRARTERLASRNMVLLSYGIIGMIEAAAGFTAYFHVLYGGGWQWGLRLASTDILYMRAITAFFTAIIICQMFNVMARRVRKGTSLKGMLSNKLLLSGIMVELILVCLIVYLPAANRFFGTSPLTAFEFLIGLPFGMAILLGDELRKRLIHADVKMVAKYLDW